MAIWLQSGFQHGADFGGVRAAFAAGIPISGWMPVGFATEGCNGNAVEFHPEYAELYGAKELEEVDWWDRSLADQYRERTRRNATESDVTLWFGSDDSKGYGATRKAAQASGKKFLKVASKFHPPDWMAYWLEANEYRVINVAGNRASIAPTLGAAVERYLAAVFAVTQRDIP